MICLDRNEAVKRMRLRKTFSITWTLKTIQVEWSYIRATQVKNYDGTPAGDGQDPDRIVLQQMTWRNGHKRRYTNHWGYSIPLADYLTRSMRCLPPPQNLMN